MMKRKLVAALILLICATSFVIGYLIFGNFHFNNKYYEVNMDTNGKMKILDHKGNAVVPSIQYTAEYGAIFNSLDGELKTGSHTIHLDNQANFHIGQDIEIRAESFMGRMNHPLVHKAKVTAVQGNIVLFSPPTTQKLAYGVFIKNVTDHIQGFDHITTYHYHIKNGKRLVIKGETKKSSVKMVYDFFTDSPEIEVTIDTTYKDQVKVFAEAIKVNFVQPVSEVYRKNGKMDSVNFQDEYWLGRQGVKFGNGESSTFVYHTPHVSSMVLKTNERALIINLDDMYDHRYFEIQGDKREKGKIRHPSEYKSGESRRNSFSLIVGCPPHSMARLMLQPYGFLATHIWTEHADNTTLATNRALYYGSDKITSSNSAIGGFVKYHVPVTKSVFYSNPYYYKHHDMGVGVVDDPAYLAFLDDLCKKGYEIALHNVHPYLIPTRKTTEQALDFMRKRLDTVTWIDHGNLKNNLSFQGLIPPSPFYSKDLWEKYKISYFWQYSSEDISTVYNDFNLLQTNHGDQMKTPLYWKHPTVTGDFYTFSASVITPIGLKRYNERNLSQLIKEWGVLINHAYPARLMTKSPYYIQKPSGELVINPGFNNVLRTMAKYRDNGELYLTTIRDLMSYWRKLNNTDFRYLDNGSVQVYNNNNEKIAGLSFVTRSSKVLVDGKIPFEKRMNGETIFWFDMNPKSIVTIATGD